jgi:hypothetical protein
MSNIEKKPSRFKVIDVPNDVKPSRFKVIDVPNDVKPSRFKVTNIPPNKHYIPPDAVIEKIENGSFTFTPVGSTPLPRDIARTRRVTYSSPRHRIKVIKGPEQKRSLSEPINPTIQIRLTPEENKKIEEDVVKVITKKHHIPPGYKITSIIGRRITVRAFGDKNSLPQDVSVEKTVVMESKDRPPIKKMKSITKRGGKNNQNRRRTRSVKKW